MSTPLTDGINALTQYANETTGKQDATLSDAVRSLASGYVKKAVYTFTPTSDVYSSRVQINESEDNILFAHWYDTTPNVYPTNNTPYEGVHIGKAICKYAEYAENSSWHLWRTNTNGATGANTYGVANPFFESDFVRPCSSPKFVAGHEYILEIYYI